MLVTLTLALSLRDKAFVVLIVVFVLFVYVRVLGSAELRGRRLFFIRGVGNVPTKLVWIRSYCTSCVLILQQYHVLVVGLWECCLLIAVPALWMLLVKQLLLLCVFTVNKWIACHHVMREEFMHIPMVVVVV